MAGRGHAGGIQGGHAGEAGRAFMQGLAFWTFSLRGGQAAVIRVRSHGVGHAPGTVAAAGPGACRRSGHLAPLP
ncbi:hypothetical protein [Novacetimonas hansenii]|uniref:Uncharacterized protein n=1 Tax=Novacetimonas hansenii TaxID=436 RepID=A0AAW5ETV1_NOVHA|nr:hypothetical protein [Novacetimonas hansenii]MCJ8354222.1 hypothetical protein [Novacetimonas hansenii]